MVFHFTRGRSPFPRPARRTSPPLGAPAIISLAAPTSLVATAAGGTQIDLTWTDNASGETGYDVEAALSPSTTFAVIASIAANSVAYSHTGLTDGQTWTYRVRATGAVGSGYSNEASATTAATTTTWNPADKGTGVTLSGDNLGAFVIQEDSVRSTVGISSGKRYLEVTIVTTPDPNETIIGIGQSTADLQFYPGRGADSRGYYSRIAGAGAPSKKINNNVETNYGITFDVGDVVGMYLDMDAGTVGFTVTGADQGIAFTGLTGTWFAMVGSASSSVSNAETATNFGQTAFAFTPPVGFSAWP